MERDFAFALESAFGGAAGAVAEDVAGAVHEVEGALLVGGDVDGGAVGVGEVEAIESEDDLLVGGYRDRAVGGSAAEEINQVGCARGGIDGDVGSGSVDCNGAIRIGYADGSVGVPKNVDATRGVDGGDSGGGGFAEGDAVDLVDGAVPEITSGVEKGVGRREFHAVELSRAEDGGAVGVDAELV